MKFDGISDNRQMCLPCGHTTGIIRLAVLLCLKHITVYALQVVFGYEEGLKLWDRYKLPNSNFATIPFEIKIIVHWSASSIYATLRMIPWGFHLC